MKAFILALLLSFSASALGADTQAKLLSDKFKLNRAQPGAMQDSQLGDKVVDKSVHVLRAVYDFSTLGGAVGTIFLRDASSLKEGAWLPKGAIIRDCIIDTITTPVGPGASISLGYTGSLTSLKGSTAVASYSGLVACVPVGSAATAIKLSSNASVAAVVLSNAVTAGKLYVVIHYELSTTD